MSQTKKTVKIIDADNNKGSSRSLNSTAHPIQMKFKNKDVYDVDNIDQDSAEGKG